MFSFFRSLTSGKTMTREGMSSVLEKMKEHLISMWVWPPNLLVIVD